MKKNNVIPLRGAFATPAERLYQDPKKAKMFQEMLDGFSSQRLSTKRYEEESIENDLRLVKQLAEFTGKYPWEWKLADWDNWNAHLFFTRGISKGTQRKNQGAIRNFLKYVTKREVFVLEVKNQFDAEFDQFIDDEEILHHLFDKEQKDPRLAFTPELSDKFFGALKQQIKIESAAPTRKLTNLQRDFALFYLIKATGLRIGSTLALNVDSFAPNFEVPELGNYGMLTVMGKGSKIITTAIDDIKVPPLLEWYIKEIRPKFLKTRNPNERALFLSERGTRMSYQSAYNRFQMRLSDADLTLLELCIHSFRHGKASESGITHGVETTRRQLNHAYASTTQGYMSIPDEYCRKQINKGLKNQIKRARARQAEEEPDKD